MTEISFHPLSEIPAPARLTDTDVHRHMPLAGDDWNAEGAAGWARARDAQWQENGYGPWVFRRVGRLPA